MSWSVRTTGHDGLHDHHRTHAGQLRCGRIDRVRALVSGALPITAPTTNDRHAVASSRRGSNCVDQCAVDVPLGPRLVDDSDRIVDVATACGARRLAGDASHFACIAPCRRGLAPARLGLSKRHPVVAAASADAVAAPRELAQVLDDLVAARRALAESRARERAAEQSRQELVSFMSHDLRTPLAGLRALSEGLEDGVIDDVPRAMSHLRATVARMSVLVDDLFALSRVQGTREAKPQTMVSLAELITDVASESAATARTQGVRLKVDLPEDDRLAVLGSSDDLARALTNLTTNAIRHTDPELVVRLAGRRTDDSHIQVAVSDSCGGI